MDQIKRFFLLLQLERFIKNYVSLTKQFFFQDKIALILESNQYKCYRHEKATFTNFTKPYFIFRPARIYTPLNLDTNLVPPLKILYINFIFRLKK